ncbi:MAG TPA: hypothetical protein VKB96_09360 [Gammaproteobacteria bacterium]|nr:hypothetical protein [Gammaproteobacteria bacterium]
MSIGECARTYETVEGFFRITYVDAVSKNLVNMAKRSCSASECSVHPAANTACIGRLGLAAFLGGVSQLWRFSVSKPFSPQPPVTQAVGRQPIKHDIR